MFKQQIVNGEQVEIPDDWLKNGNPFEIKRPEYSQEIKFGGYVRIEYNEKLGRNVYVQDGYQSVMAVPYDLPVVGYNNGIVNSLRIWDAEPLVQFNLDSFDKGDYQKAVEQENLAKSIVEVLYPNDNHYSGKELRLKQQYFFVSASLQQVIKKFKATHDDIHQLPDKVVFQLNDTHPTVTVPELMRILIDEENLEWMMHGISHQDAVLIRTTPSWLKPLKNGRLTCLCVCCREFIRSWRRLTVVS